MNKLIIGESMEITLPFSMNTYPDEPVDINILIKVCPSEHVDDVINGNLYMKPFEYFRSLEENKIRGDVLEGIDSSYRSEDIELQMADNNGNFKSISGLTNRLNFHKNYIKNSNLFSMSGFCLKNSIEEINYFYLDPGFSTFGDKTVLIYDVPEFFLKINNAFNSKKKIIQIPNEPFYLRHIHYVAENFNGRMGVFRKLEAYKWQQELRIAIYRDVKFLCPKPYYFKIGSLKYISLVFDTAKLISEGLIFKRSNNPR
jgi:hypothetical protein